MRCALLAVLLLVTLVGAGCGQKGPLYLRDFPPPGVKPPKPEAYKPLPYPKEVGDDGSAGAAKK